MFMIRSTRNIGELNVQLLFDHYQILRLRFKCQTILYLTFHRKAHAYMTFK